MSELIHKTIYNLLGGNDLVVMTGAKNFTCDLKDNNLLGFRLPMRLAKHSINGVIITYSYGTDLFTVTFKTIKGIKSTVVSIVEDVYAEDLRKVFEHETGLVLTKPRVMSNFYG